MGVSCECAIWVIALCIIVSYGYSCDCVLWVCLLGMWHGLYRKDVSSGYVVGYVVSRICLLGMWYGYVVRVCRVGVSSGYVVCLS